MDAVMVALAWLNHWFKAVVRLIATLVVAVAPMSLPTARRLKPRLDLVYLGFYRKVCAGAWTLSAVVEIQSKKKEGDHMRSAFKELCEFLDMMLEALAGHDIPGLVERHPRG